MPKKCESCEHLLRLDPDDFEFSICRSTGVNAHETVNFCRVPTMTEAREICNKEGDGIFVYFEPKTPTAGAAFVQITREPKATTAAAGGAR